MVTDTGDRSIHRVIGQKLATLVIPATQTIKEGEVPEDTLRVAQDVSQRICIIQKVKGKGHVVDDVGVVHCH